MISIINKIDCCGCSACVQICPTECIIMVSDKEGFEYPLVDVYSCINCHLCEKVCPVIGKDEHSQEPPKKCFAYVHKDSVIRSESSSGGAFSALSNYILEKGGVVFGAKFNEHWDVVIGYADSSKGLRQFRGSKYVQSKVCNSYKIAKSFLDQERYVLFSGTPCQILGLRRFLRKDYLKLITVDIVCHSAPSPAVWKKYLHSFSTCPEKDITYVNFRNKSLNGWNNYSLHIQKNGKDIVTSGNHENEYMRGFLENLYSRPSCSCCPARGYRSRSDIMLADFWHIEKYHAEPFYNDNRGVSLVMSFTEKGMNLIAHSLENEYLTEVDYAEVEAFGVHDAIMHSYKPHKFRNIFFKLFNLIDIRILINLCIKTKKIIKILAYPIIKKR